MVLSNGKMSHKALEMLEEVLVLQVHPQALRRDLETWLVACESAGLGREAVAWLAEPRRSLLFKLLESGPYARSLLCRFPHWWPLLVAQMQHADILSLRDMAKTARVFMERDGKIAPFDGQQAAPTLDGLRRFHHFENLRLGLAELTQTKTIDISSREIAQVAEVVCDGMLDVVRQQVEEQWGKPEPQARGFFVLGMGKLGGLELNFSSDIDLIPYYRTDRGEVVAGTAKASEVTLHEYYTRIAERFIKALGERTAEGFAYRVDLRLRPEGTRGPLANSMQSAQQYYETWGTLWERAAYLKARPIAGDRALAREFLHALEPFIYRRHLDFHVLNEMRNTKRLITEEIARREGSERDLKLGRGGIREIEFFVQTLQLLHGGRELQLRTGNTFQTLERLEHLGLLKSEDAADLTSAYGFLRRLEHLIQLHDNQQTHHLPNDEHQRRFLAVAMGYVDVKTFDAALLSHRDRVHELFMTLLSESQPAQQSQTHGTLAQDLLVLVHENVGELSPQALKPWEAITRQLAQTLQRLPDWRRYLKPFAELFRTTGSQPDFYHRLFADAKAFERLLAMLERSDFLSEIVLRRPGLILNTVPDEVAGRAAFESELQHRLATTHDRGEAMDALRMARQQRLFQIGLLDLDEELSMAQTQKALTETAEACLAAASAYVHGELRERYGNPRNAQGDLAHCVLVGLGTLGGQEMRYTSDLDLIFVYSDGGDTDGSRSVSNHEYFTLFAQRLLSFLTTATHFGIAYNVDTRLRPSGNAGALVSSREAFRRYHEERSQLWEIQALLRARAIVGEVDFSDIIDRRSRRDWTSQSMAAEFHRMRSRIEAERAQSRASSTDEIDLKLGAGGMVDVEFITQYLSLTPPIIAQPHTRRALEVLMEQRRLSPHDGEVLLGAYDLYCELGGRLALVCNRSIERVFVGMPRLDEIARAMAHDRAQNLLESLRERAAWVRKIYLAILGMSR